MPDVPCEAGKACRAFVHDGSCPAAPDGGQAVAVVDVKFLAQRMAQLVRGEILFAAEAGQAVVRQGACPHDFAHSLLVMCVMHGGRAVFQHDAQQCLGQLIRQSVIGDGVKIPVERVHENVAHAARDLMHRERRGEQGVENGEGPILFGCLALGELIVYLTGIKLPSSIIGMLLLTLFLQLGWVKLHWVQGLSDFLVANLGFFFVPSGVALMLYFDIIEAQFWPIVVATLVSTVLVLVVTGWVHQLVRKYGLFRK